MLVVAMKPLRRVVHHEEWSGSFICVRGPLNHLQDVEANDSSSQRDIIFRQGSDLAHASYLAGSK
jgi:hypothetical protein